MGDSEESDANLYEENTYNTAVSFSLWLLIWLLGFSLVTYFSA